MSKRHRQNRQADRAEQPDETDEGPMVYMVDPQAHRAATMDNLRLVKAARAELEQMQDHWVIVLMACGVSFAEIAAVLEISRQAVHRRYSNRAHRLNVHPDGSVSYTAVGSRECRLARVSTSADPADPSVSTG
jgi:DNA-directed RNA polymerase specialized sigma24 family protein